MWGGEKKLCLFLAALEQFNANDDCLMGVLLFSVDPVALERPFVHAVGVWFIKMRGLFFLPSSGTLILSGAFTCVDCPLMRFVW
jgi:hypothetical protein